MFDHIFQFLTLHISKPTQVTLLGDLWFLQVFLLDKKNGTFLANGLQKKHLSPTGYKKNIFSQRATNNVFLANGLQKINKKTFLPTGYTNNEIYENINATFGFRNFM